MAECLHPRDRKLLQDAAALAQTSQLTTAAGLKAEKRELRQVAKASLRQAEREELLALLDKEVQEAALASLTPTGAKGGNTAGAKQRANKKKSQASGH